MADNLAEAIAEHYEKTVPKPEPFRVDPVLEAAAVTLEQVRKVDAGVAGSPGLAGTRAAVDRYMLDKAHATEQELTR